MEIAVNGNGKKNSLLESVLIRIGEALLPISQLDSQSFKDLLSEIGISAQNNLGLTDLVDSVNELSKVLHSDKPDILILMAKLEIVYNRIPSLVPGHGSFTKRFVDYFLIQYLQHKNDYLYHLFLLIGIIELKPMAESPPYILRTFRWDMIIKFISKPNSFMNNILSQYGWNLVNSELDWSKLLVRIGGLVESLGLLSGLYKQDETIASQLDAGGMNNLELRISFSTGKSWKPEESKGAGYEEAGLNVSPWPSSIHPANKHTLDNKPVKGISILPYKVATNDTKVTEFDVSLSPEGNNWALTFNLKSLPESAEVAFNTGIGVIFAPNNKKILYDLFQNGKSLEDFNLSISLQSKTPSPNEIVLFATADNSISLKASGISYALIISKKNNKFEAAIEMKISEINFIIGGDFFDNLLKKIAPKDGFNLKLKDLTIGFSSKRNFYFGFNESFQTTLNYTVPIGKRIGPFTLNSVNLSLKMIGKEPASKPELSISVSGTGTFANFVSVEIEKLGITSFLPELDEGFLMQLGKESNSKDKFPFQFKKPDGLGFSISQGQISGGGFIRSTTNGYDGAIELDLASFKVQAIVIIESKPDVSLLLVVFAKFKPPIQLGAGWKLTRIGGLIGFHRYVKEDEISKGIKDGSIENILFPENILSNSQNILSQFKRFFPYSSKNNIVGPAVKLEYGTPTLLEADFEIITDFPPSGRILIIGKLSSNIPNKRDALIKVNMGILGRIDFNEGKIQLKGSLYNSEILGFPLSGDIIVAASWKKSRYFIMSVGGFNPKYTPPSDFPIKDLSRLSVSVTSWVNIQGYWAMTPNTTQMGGKAEAKLEGGGASIEGAIEFDSIVQYSPLKFEYNFRASLSVKYKGKSFASMGVRGDITGPYKMHITGTFSFKLLIKRVHAYASFSYGEDKTIAEKTDLLEILRKQVIQNSNWKVDAGDWINVGIIKNDSSVDDGSMLLDPFGTIMISQNVVPLLEYITRFGTAIPAPHPYPDIPNFIPNWFNLELSYVIKRNPQDPGRFYPLNTLYTLDEFSPGQFFTMDDEKALTSASYVSMKSGIKALLSKLEERVLFGPSYSIRQKTVNYDGVTYYRSDKRDTNKKIFNRAFDQSVKTYASRKRSKKLFEKYRITEKTEIRYSKPRVQYMGENELASDGYLETVLQSQENNLNLDLFSGVDPTTLEYRLKNFNKYDIDNIAMKKIQDNLGKISLVNQYEKVIAQTVFTI